MANARAIEQIENIHEGIMYPPSILMIVNGFSEPSHLKRKLEKFGCQVSWINLGNLEALSRIKHKYFDLIVFRKCQRAVLKRIYQALKTQRDLEEVPVVILGKDDELFKDQMMTEIGITSSIYYVSIHSRVEMKLLQIIQQIHYLKYRYN